MAGECAGHIDQVHQPAAEQIAERIGIVRQHHFHHFRLRFPHRTRRERLTIVVLGRSVNQSQNCSSRRRERVLQVKLEEWRFTRVAFNEEPFNQWIALTH